MKRLLLFGLLSFTSISLTNAQGRFKPDRFLEVGVLLGLTNYSGDIADTYIELAETKPGFGFYTRYHANPKWGVKGHFYLGSISGDDKNAPTRRQRYFSFETNLLEIGLVGEWKPFAKTRQSKTGIHMFYFTPYLFGGVGFTFANAEAKYYGPAERRNEVLRVPLPEEGLRTTFITTPVGIGLRADIAERFIIGAEGGWRPVYSDHLDGISLNGNPDKNDWYYFVGITFSLVMSGKSSKIL